MDIGVIVALVVAITLTLVAGVLAGLFGGMWWQARKTAEVWEKAYTHVRELVAVIQHDTYNTGRPELKRGVAAQFTPAAPAPVHEKERVVVQAATSSSLPPITPSADAQKAAGITLDDDPYGTGNRLDR